MVAIDERPNIGANTAGCFKPLLAPIAVAAVVEFAEMAQEAVALATVV